MPATVTTKESYDKSTSRKALKKEVELRIMAGAIRSTIIDNGDNWIIETEWNVFGQQ